MEWLESSQESKQNHLQRSRIAPVSLDFRQIPLQEWSLLVSSICHCGWFLTKGLNKILNPVATSTRVLLVGWGAVTVRPWQQRSLQCRKLTDIQHAETGKYDPNITRNTWLDEKLDVSESWISVSLKKKNYVYSLYENLKIIFQIEEKILSVLWM